MVKLCRKCNKLKEHHKHTKSKDGLQYWCADCRKSWKREERLEYFRQTYRRDKGRKWRNYFYIRKYNLMIEQYEKLIKQQNGKCAICLKKCSSGKRLAVDHNHKTGMVRGLLCTNCNAMIAHAKEDIQILQLGIQYLRKKIWRKVRCLLFYLIVEMKLRTSY